MLSILAFLLSTLSGVLATCAGTPPPSPTSLNAITNQPTPTRQTSPVQTPVPTLFGVRSTPTTSRLPRPTRTPTATSTASPSPTASPSATSTPVPATNTPSATPSPTPLPSPRPTPTPRVAYWEDSIVIATYPYTAYLKAAQDPGLNGFPYWAFDRNAYLAAHPTPRPQTYKRLNLENRYLRVSFLPELGGRVYEMVFRPTGNNELYQNQVIKPTHWGPTSPSGANWWLAAGGIEWGFPVDEHGYEFGIPWMYQPLPTRRGYGVTLWDGGTQRPNVRVQARLEEDTAAIFFTFHLLNPTDKEVRIKFWHNAMVAPGPTNTLGPSFQFIYPIRQAVVHSTSDPDLPGPYQVFSWPMYKGRDFSYPRNWRGWVGFFAYPQAEKGWAAVYDHNMDEGILRIFPPTQAPGLKGFGFGQAIPPSEWTDDGTVYAEMHGGAAPTFRDWLVLPPRSERTWQETWYPIWKMDGITQASDKGALYVAREGNRLRIQLFPVRPYEGTLTLSLGGKRLWQGHVSMAPDTPLQRTFSLSEEKISGPLEITLSQGEQIVLHYTQEMRSK